MTLKLIRYNEIIKKKEIKRIWNGVRKRIIEAYAEDPNLWLSFNENSREDENSDIIPRASISPSFASSDVSKGLPK